MFVKELSVCEVICAWGVLAGLALGGIIKVNSSTIELTVHPYC